MSLFLVATPASCSEALRIAVASNFTNAARQLAGEFEKSTGHESILITGSTGKHYAQIMNGAPYDLFLAADSKRPELLEAEGVAVPGSRFTYAIGRLVLWSPLPGFDNRNGASLEAASTRYIAIANPKLAPYGKAAMEAMQSLGHWPGRQQKLVRGESVGQAFQFVSSGNAELGFVALSQIVAHGVPERGSVWLVPQSLHSPIEQQAVQLSRKQVAGEFLAYLRGEQARASIRSFGYETPSQ